MPKPRGSEFWSIARILFGISISPNKLGSLLSLKMFLVETGEKKIKDAHILEAEDILLMFNG